VLLGTDTLIVTDSQPLPVLADLTARELEVIDAARDGTMLICSALPVDQLANDQDQAHEVRAELLRELLLGRRGPVDPRGVRLTGARIIGLLDLDTISTSTGLRLIKCVFPDGIDAANCHLPWLWLNGSHIDVLLARQLKVDSDMRLDGLRVGGTENGSISLQGAHIGGNLHLDGAEITNDVGPTLLADGLKVDGNLYLQRVRVTGSGVGSELRLTGAHIGGQLRLNHAQIVNGTGSALLADRLKVDEDLLLMDVRVTGSGKLGAIRLHGARIGGMLDLDGAKITNDTGPALRIDRLQIDGNLDLRNVRVTGAGELGAIRLFGARIGGMLDLGGATITNDSGLGLNLQEAHVGEVTHLPAAVVCSAPIQGISCVDPTSVDLDRFVFGALSGIGWRGWLHIIRFHTMAYRPGPYQQLAAVERAAGHDGNARRILIDQQHDLYQRAPKAIGNWLTRRFHWLWGKLAGYGYHTRRTMGALLLALAFAGALGYIAGQVETSPGHHAAERTVASGSAAGAACSTIELVGLGLDRGLPLGSTGLRARCDLDTATRLGQAFTIAIWLVQATVWGLATLALAGYTGLIRKAG
jgi:hypothetical protein